MNFFSSYFFKNKDNLKFPKSQIIDILRDINNSDELFVFENISIYHRSKTIVIPLLILDTKRGLFIFEYKQWTYNYLKNSTIDTATNQTSKNNNLSFKKTNLFLKQKLNDLTNSNEIKIFNFAILENLTSYEYDALDEYHKELLPKSRIIFKDSSVDEILNKFNNIQKSEIVYSKISSLAATLLVQYLIMDDTSKNLATKEQIRFIDSDINSHETLSVPSYSGRSSSILLKSILQMLKRPNYKIIIIAPNTISCDLLKQKLLNILEYAMIDLDLTSIEIITPIELLNKHYKKLRQEPLDEELNITNDLMNKKFNAADLIICDNADLFPQEFISYLVHIQKKSALLLVTQKDIFDKKHTFEKSFRQKNQEYILKKTNPYPKALHIIQELLKDHNAKDILVVSSNTNREKLHNDLHFFIEEETAIFDSSINLINQSLDNLTLSSYDHISTIRYKFIILLDIDSASIEQLVYLSDLALMSVYFLYDEECEKTDILRSKFENVKE